MKYLTIRELGTMLGNRSRSAIYDDIKHQRLPQPTKLGGRIYWSQEEVEQHLKTSTAQQRQGGSQ